jgi:hypothetical protein
MNPSQPLFNLDGFKAICSGRNCDREPKIKLRVKYLKKVGEFCELCANDLMDTGLVEESIPHRNACSLENSQNEI